MRAWLPLGISKPLHLWTGKPYDPHSNIFTFTNLKKDTLIDYRIIRISDRLLLIPGSPLSPYWVISSIVAIVIYHRNKTTGSMLTIAETLQKLSEIYRFHVKAPVTLTRYTFRGASELSTEVYIFFARKPAKSSSEVNWLQEKLKKSTEVKPTAWVPENVRRNLNRGRSLQGIFEPSHLSFVYAGTWEKPRQNGLPRPTWW